MEEMDDAKESKKMEMTKARTIRGAVHCATVAGIECGSHVAEDSCTEHSANPVRGIDPFYFYTSFLNTSSWCVKRRGKCRLYFLPERE